MPWKMSSLGSAATSRTCPTSTPSLAITGALAGTAVQAISCSSSSGATSGDDSTAAPCAAPLPYAGARGRRGCGAAGGGWSRGGDHQPGQGLLRGAGRDQARPGPLLPLGGGAGAARDGRQAGAAAAVPARRGRPVVLPEARARPAP